MPPTTDRLLGVLPHAGSLLLECAEKMLAGFFRIDTRDEDRVAVPAWLAESWDTRGAECDGSPWDDRDA